MVDPLAPGEAGSRPAITIAGRTIVYAQLNALIDTVRVPQAGPLDLADHSVVDTLVAVFAAARAGSPVVLRAPESPAVSASALAQIPAGTFLLVMTSGTSGRPRAVLRTAESWTSSFSPFTALTGLTRDDSVLLTGPLHATLHLFAAVHTLWLGAHLTDQRSAATAVHAVPTVLADLLADPPARLRTAVVAGAAVPPSLEVRASEVSVKMIEYYGAAELSFVGARVAPAPLVAFPGVDVRGDDGVIWARSPYLALGRLSPGSPVAFDDMRDVDGFVTVGDLGTIDDSGVLTIRGRADAAVTTGGSTVVVEDVEAVLNTLSGVKAVAVIGLPHVRLGQVVTAVVELEPGVQLETIRQAARKVLTGSVLPRRWHRIDKLPRLRGGKMARARLAADLAADPVGGRPGNRSVR